MHDKSWSVISTTILDSNVLVYRVVLGSHFWASMVFWSTSRCETLSWTFLAVYKSELADSWRTKEVRERFDIPQRLSPGPENLQWSTFPDKLLLWWVMTNMRWWDLHSHMQNVGQPQPTACFNTALQYSSERERSGWTRRLNDELQRPKSTKDICRFV